MSTIALRRVAGAVLATLLVGAGTASLAADQVAQLPAQTQSRTTVHAVPSYGAVDAAQVSNLTSRSNVFVSNGDEGY